MTLRTLTELEQWHIRVKHTCPFCGGDTSAFRVRATGGLSQNLHCPCGAGFNLASFQGKYLVADLIAEPEAKPSES